VSDQANGSTGFQESQLSHRGKKIRLPERPEWNPHARGEAVTYPHESSLENDYVTDAPHTKELLKKMFLKALAELRPDGNTFNFKAWSVLLEFAEQE